jgi:hypothetical protein
MAFLTLRFTLIFSMLTMAISAMRISINQLTRIKTFPFAFAATVSLMLTAGDAAGENDLPPGGKVLLTAGGAAGENDVSPGGKVLGQFFSPGGKGTMFHQEVRF